MKSIYILIVSYGNVTHKFSFDYDYDRDYFESSIRKMVDYDDEIKYEKEELHFFKEAV